MEGELPEPAADQVRIAVEAAGVSQADITIRQGMYPQSAPLPFTLGYDVVGRVDKVGSQVRSLRVGQRVAAITVRGSYTRYLCWPAEDVTPVPEGVEPAKAPRGCQRIRVTRPGTTRGGKEKSGKLDEKSPRIH